MNFLPKDFVLIYDAETDAWTTMNRFTAGGHVGSGWSPFGKENSSAKCQ